MQDLIRVDKNFAHNIMDFSMFQEDKLLVKSLIYYFCWTYEKNIFGFGTLDPYDFAAKFGFTPNYLRSRHPNPKQLQGKKDKEVKKLYDIQRVNPSERVYDTFLENALFRLRTETVYFSNGGKVFESDGSSRHIAKIGEIRFLKDFEVTITKTRSGQKKIVYTYELDPNFIDNLTSYYMKANQEAVKALRKPGLDDLYLYIKNLKENLFLKKEYIATPSFNLLCKLAHINDKEPKQRKKKLNKSMDRVKEFNDLDIDDFFWTKGENMRYAYQPVIHYKKLFEGTRDDKVIKNERFDIFTQNLMHELLNTFRKKYPKWYDSLEREDNFLKWLQKGPDKDRKEKAMSFTNAHFKTWNKAVDQYDQPTITFLNNVYKIKEINDVKKILRGEAVA